MDTHFTFELVVILFVLAMGHGVLSTLIARREPIIVWTRRLAAATLLAWTLWHGWIGRPPTPAAWLAVAWNGVLLAWVVLCAARLLLLVMGAFYDLLFAPLTQPLHAFMSNAHENGAARRQELKERREAPVRERALALQVADAALARRRRDDARASAYLLYSLYAPKVGDRLTRTDLDRYMESFMNDEQPPEAVEQRGRELLAILERHVSEVDPFAHGEDLASLIARQNEEFQRLESLPIDAAMKREYAVLLRRRFDEIIKRSLREIRP